jgi:hypothetical protein
MRQLGSVLVMTLLPLLSVAQAASTTQQFAVGTCEPNVQSYSTISQGGQHGAIWRYRLVVPCS